MTIPSPELKAKEVTKVKAASQALDRKVLEDQASRERQLENIQELVAQEQATQVPKAQVEVTQAPKDLVGVTQARKDQVQALAADSQPPEDLQVDIQALKPQVLATQARRDLARDQADLLLATQEPRGHQELVQAADTQARRVLPLVTQELPVDSRQLKEVRDLQQVPRATQAGDQVRHSQEPNRAPNSLPESTCPQLMDREYISDMRCHT